MAFGKDQGHLPNIPGYGGNFIQKAKTQARRPQRTGRGNVFYWRDTYKPPEYTPDIIRLIPSEYTVQVTHDGETVIEETLPYFPFREHHNGKRGCVCNGGPLWASKDHAQPCPACTIFWEDVNERKAKKARGDTTKGPNRMSCRDQFAFNVWDYGLYFEMPEFDSNGQMRVSQKTGKPYTHWEKGNPNDPKYAGKPWKQGHLMAWPMAQTYKDTFIEWAKKVGGSCKGCGSMDSIRTVMKICGNPQCGQYIYDPNNCTLSNEQREQIDYYPYTCTHCKQTNYVSEVIECSRCQSPVRATIFDVDFQIQRLGTAGQQTFLQIFSHSEPRPIQVADPEVLKTIKPLDLVKKFAPHPPEVQAKIFNIQFAPQPQGAAPMMAPPMTPPMMAPPQVPPSQYQQPQPQYPPQQYQQPQVTPPQIPPMQGALGAAPQAAGQMPAVPYTVPTPQGGQQ